jgi:hypothetical protein
MAKFTFKTEKQTGKYRAFYVPFHYIKLDGKEVGNIDHDAWRIRLMIYDEALKGTNCEWKWILLKHVPVSLEEAKAFLIKNQIAIESKYKLHKLEE